MSDEQPTEEGARGNPESRNNHAGLDDTASRVTPENRANREGQANPRRGAERGGYVRDLRQYAGQTNLRLIAGAVLVLFIVGDGLIYWIYGPGAAMLGLLCLLGGLTPVVLIALLFWLLDWVVKRANRE